MTEWRWNRPGSTSDGLRVIQDDREYVGQLTKKRPAYDPFRGSSRGYVWTDDSNCKDSDPDLFQVSQMGDPEVAFLPKGRTDLLAQHNRAKAEVAKLICEGCPVRATCLELASTSDLHWSVRGGQTPKRLLRNKAIPSFPLQEYMPWTCVQCGGEKYGWHMNTGKRRKYCIPCSA